MDSWPVSSPPNKLAVLQQSQLSGSVKRKGAEWKREDEVAGEDKKVPKEMWKTAERVCFCTVLHIKSVSLCDLHYLKCFIFFFSRT